MTLAKFQPVTPPRDAVVAQLARVAVETLTGQTTQALTLANAPVPPISVFVNGVRLAPTDYVVEGRTLTLWPTLTRPLVAGDVVDVHHHFATR